MAKQKIKSIPASKKPAAAKKNVASGKKTSAASSKSTGKKAVSQKESLTKKPVVKKNLAKKVVAKKIGPVKKQAPPPKKAPAKKTAKPIIKSAPAKKPAKLVVKKAALKQLANTKKTSVPKSTGKDKKAVEASTIKYKKQAAKPEASNSVDHIQKLKSALSKTSEKTRESKKAQKPFVMPKTSTEKSRKYEPQFVKSVLDQVPEVNNGPSMRYSDNELTEFRDLIMRKLETAKKELGYLQGLITRKDEMGGDDTDNRYMTMEDGSLSMEREQLSQMASRQITFIDHLEKAMMRIENKTYGICRVTGKLIDKARLRAVPHATLSIEAKMGISK